MMPYIAIVQQPACTNVIIVGGPEILRLYQHTKSACIGYAEAASRYEAGDDGNCLEIRHFRCGTGDATKEVWTEIN